MNYYPFHIGDYLSATRHLTWAEDAAYRRLLDVYYTAEKPLPLELRAVYRLVVASTDEQREAVLAVLNEFFIQSEAGWINSRADIEIATMRDKQQKQRDKANKRWHKPEAEPGNASAMPQQAAGYAAASKGDADAMPPTPTPTPTPELKTKTARKRAAPGALVSADDLVNAGVDRQHADDWLLARKGKSLPLTPTAWADTQAEAIKAGLTVPEAIGRAAANGWAGFKAAWLANAEGGRHGNAPPSYLAEKQAEAAKWAYPPKADFEFIDMEAQSAPLALR